MTASLPESKPSSFLSVVLNLGLLDEDVAKRLDERSTTESRAAVDLAREAGLLDTIQADIVETLLKPGDAIPGYEILAPLGYGGMGVVYRARQQNLDRIVALKTVLASSLSRSDALLRFQREAKVVARLDHPNIVSAHDLGESQGRFYLVMEYIEGLDLEKRIQKTGPMDERTSLAITKQVAAGLEHAARMDVIHRDIKPANILLVQPPSGYTLPLGTPMAKITDFGLALLNTEEQAPDSRLTAANTTVGSPHYMAPEQISGDALDLRVDIYALGATLYHMLVGEPPFMRQSLSEIFASKFRGEVPSVREKNPRVSTKTQALVNEMMACAIDCRIHRYRDLLKRLDKLIEDAPEPEVTFDTTTVVLGTQQIPRPNVVGESTDEHTLLESDADQTKINTTTISPQVQPAKPRPRWLLPTAVLSLIVIAGLWFAFQNFQGRVPTAAELPLKPSDWGEPLYVPGDLGVWQLSSLSKNGQRVGKTGTWREDKNQDDVPVLSGDGGWAPRKLVRKKDDTLQPLSRYRVTLDVQLNQANAIEVQFAIQTDGSHALLRIDEKSVSLGRREQAEGEWKQMTKPASLVKSKTDYHSVRLERQDQFWWIAFEDQPIGVIPFGRNEPLPEFRLAVDKGPAWFSDITVIELEKPAVSN